MIKPEKVGKRVREELTEFQEEFRKYLANFITGALAFVAALLWRDAISSFLLRYKEYIENSLPFKELWVTQFFVALIVSFIAVFGIVLMSRLMKTKK
ncbi:hypothetical protein DRN62_00940 [Nanoarchaeota archaeon]|nr:MAG: hypothetical protein DRN62_00940 [Nanoarchaeota archaeon]